MRAPGELTVTALVLATSKTAVENENTQRKTNKQTSKETNDTANKQNPPADPYNVADTNERALGSWTNSKQSFQPRPNSAVEMKAKKTNKRTNKDRTGADHNKRHTTDNKDIGTDSNNGRGPPERTRYTAAVRYSRANAWRGNVSLEMLL